MIVQGFNNISAFDGAMAKPGFQREQPSATPTGDADTLTLSDAAKSLLAGTGGAADQREIQKNLDAIKAKPALQRTAADTAYLGEHDERFIQIQDKMKASGRDALDASDVDYLQKATGMVNTMAYLSPDEKALYDDLVSKGQTEAAHGLMLIGMSRIGMEGQEVTLPDGQSFDPTQTALTGDKIRNLFKQMFVDTSGSAGRALDALAAALDQRQTSEASQGA